MDSQDMDKFESGRKFTAARNRSRLTRTLVRQMTREDYCRDFFKWFAALLQEGMQRQPKMVLELTTGSPRNLNRAALIRLLEHPDYQAALEEIGLSATSVLKKHNTYMNQWMEQAKMRREDEIRRLRKFLNGLAETSREALRKGTLTPEKRKSLGYGFLEAGRLAISIAVLNGKEVAEGLHEEVDFADLKDRMLDVLNEAQGDGRLLDDLRRGYEALDDPSQPLFLTFQMMKTACVLLGENSPGTTKAKISLALSLEDEMPPAAYVEVMKGLAAEAEALESKLEAVEEAAKYAPTHTPNRLKLMAWANGASKLCEQVILSKNPASAELESAQQLLEAIERADPKFPSLRVMKATWIAAARKEGHVEVKEARSFWTKLGQDRAKQLLRRLDELERNEFVVEFVRQQAFEVYPDLSRLDMLL